MHEDVDFQKLATPTEIRKWAKQNNLMYGGLIAVGVVILQGFLTVSPLGASGKISVVAFAISLPLLAVLIMLDELQSGDKSLRPSMTDEAAKALALLSSLVGVAAAFWHIEWFAGVAVIAAGIIALGVYGTHFSGNTFNQAALRRRQQRADRQVAAGQTSGPPQASAAPPTPEQQSPTPETSEQPTTVLPTTPPESPTSATPPVEPPAHPGQ